MQDAAAIDWITEKALQTLARGERIAPAALTFLLRRYAETGRDDISEALGPALAGAIAMSHEAADGESTERAEWLSLLVEAAAISSDDRLPGAIAAFVSRLRRAWPARGDVAPAVRSIEACLTAASALPDLVNPRDLVPSAVDELERIVHAAYQPGEGVAHGLGPDGPPGTLGDHVATASALLTANAVTGRLPYAMLAEELMQFAQRTNPAPGTTNLERFIARSEAARILCRLATLHADEDYRQAAVIAGGSDYAGDAKRLLTSLAAEYREHGADAVAYGLALLDSR